MPRRQEDSPEEAPSSGPILRESMYLYVDEAGNFDFSPSGSRYFILTGIVLHRPFDYIGRLAAIKYDCLEEGLWRRGGNYHEFHATDDRQTVRDRVFKVIANEIDGLVVVAIVVRKNKVRPDMRAPEKLYALVFEQLVTWVSSNQADADEVIAVTDRIRLKGKNAALKASLKRYLKERFENRGVPYRLYQHQSESDFNLQVVDYCSWAIQRFWELGDDRSRRLIENSIAAEIDLLANSDVEYY